MKITDYLAEKKVSFEVTQHPVAFAASRLAEKLHVPGKQFAKTVLLRADHGTREFVAVLPADRQVDLVALGRQLDGVVELGSEKDVVRHCPDCEIGALPPFGSQYGLETIVDERLAANENIVFEGNTHDEAIRMRFDDFVKLEHPKILSFATVGP